MTNLPDSNTLDIGALSRSFSNVTNSYKLLFFQGLLSCLKGTHFGYKLIIPINAIGIEMIALAWYPYIYFKLSFGLQDKTHRCLDKLRFHLSNPNIAGNAETQNQLHTAIKEQWNIINGDSLLRFVPYRLLTPFFEDRLRGAPDPEKNKRISELSQQFFDERKPFYKIDKTGSTIEIHPSWYKYFIENMPIIEGWAKWHWLHYLQRRNPNVPAISEKTSPPINRGTLTTPKKYWSKILENKKFTCIYSGKTLDPENFDIDHFIPWSFVCHDRSWNLLPVDPSVNSAKGNTLPDESFITSLVDTQYKGLEIGKQIIDKRVWNSITEPFFVDLHLSESDLFEHNRLEQAYMETLPALYQLAKQLGFSSGWKL